MDQNLPNRYRFGECRTGLRASTLPGFSTSPIWRFRPQPGSCPLGLFSTKIIDDHNRGWLIAVGLGQSPIDSTPYIRTAFVRVTRPGEEKPYGFSLAGDSFRPTEIKDLGFPISKADDADISELEEAWKVMVGIIDLFHMHACIEGARVLSPKAMAGLFEKGYIDYLVAATVGCQLYDFLRKVDPNSLELVPDLNFEIGLGIVDYDKAPPMPAIPGVVNPSSTEEDGATKGFYPLVIPDVQDTLGIASLFSEEAGASLGGLCNPLVIPKDKPHHLLWEVLLRVPWDTSGGYNSFGSSNFQGFFSPGLTTYLDKSLLNTANMGGYSILEKLVLLPDPKVTYVNLTKHMRNVALRKVNYDVH